MKLGDLLLFKGIIDNKQLTEALSKQADQAINYNRAIPLGKVLIELKYVTVDDITNVLNEQSEDRKERKVQTKEIKMPTEIGEGSKFTFDLKFIATMGMILVSACTIYFSITGQLNELAANNSPNRLEHDYLKGEVDLIKSTGDLKLITYQLAEFKETFIEIKSLASQLTPLASDLEYIKTEINKLKNKEVPQVDLSSIEFKLDNLSSDINSLEERITKLENKKDGGRF